MVINIDTYLLCR